MGWVAKFEDPTHLNNRQLVAQPGVCAIALKLEDCILIEAVALQPHLRTHGQALFTHATAVDAIAVGIGWQTANPQNFVHLLFCCGRCAVKGGGNDCYCVAQAAFMPNLTACRTTRLHLWVGVLLPADAESVGRVRHEMDVCGGLMNDADEARWSHLNPHLAWLVHPGEDPIVAALHAALATGCLMPRTKAHIGFGAPAHCSFKLHPLTKVAALLLSPVVV
mmetsp:Transcript_72731/g.121409  ORF Transcript_72731/g.121409 Transcript_72731/m.121409 type:complete len:221 (+) Transcript_72731:2405-3067(+)